MCTAISMRCGENHFFGRTLDLEYSYAEEVVLTPRKYVFDLQHKGRVQAGYAMVGMATVAKGYPLYYEATNEAGLSVAALNFPGNAKYRPFADGKLNLASFEVIPYILSRCASVREARELLSDLNITTDAFSEELLSHTLHWIIADASSALTLEFVGEMRIYENAVGVLTNSPPFAAQMSNLARYINLTPDAPSNSFAKRLELVPSSQGCGALGLPGDFSSESRFVRAAFVKENSQMPCERHGIVGTESVSQAFHVLSSVAIPRGVMRNDKGESAFTRYTCVTDTGRGVYYYTTYGNRRISAVDMRSEVLDGTELIRYRLSCGENVFFHGEN